MTTPESDLRAWLIQTLEDRRFSRGERQAFTKSLDDEAERAEARRIAFEIAREQIERSPDVAIIDWLDDVVKATRENAGSPGARSARADAHFSPGEECLRAIIRLVEQSRAQLDICVFTITDDRLSTTLIEAHRRRLPIRIITDNEKAEDLGSDIARLEEAGIPVRVDRSPYHMHHKFAIADGKTLLTGSYNWTRGAARDNQENLIVTDEPRLIAPFARMFDRLWNELS
ncbi:MAG: phospholipase D-like domain-containing protein [Isosphaeraceae bacterium]|nr:phospholipase D-like domain-containing protein [Isosphaeraceae bacterium]